MQNERQLESVDNGHGAILPLKRSNGGVQTGHDQATHEAPEPVGQTPMTPVNNPHVSKNIPPPPLFVWTMILLVPIIKAKKRKGKNSGVLKKLRKVLMARVNAQLTIDK